MLFGAAYEPQPKREDGSYSVRHSPDICLVGPGGRIFKRFELTDDPKAIADGPSILAYLEETAHEFGIDRHIRFQTRVVRADWSSPEARWSVEVAEGSNGARRRLSSHGA